MKREYTNETPKLIKGTRNKLIDILNEFAKREEKVMVLTPEPTEYASVYSMVSSLSNAIKRNGYPMEVFTYKGKGYIKKLI